MYITLEEHRNLAIMYLALSNIARKAGDIVNADLFWQDCIEHHNESLKSFSGIPLYNEEF